MIGIYKIVSPTGKTYIGKSTNIEKRWNHYKFKSAAKSQNKLYNSLRKHGYDNHTFEVICECTCEELDTLEVHYIKELNTTDGITGLNLHHGGTGGNIGEEGRKKISESKKKYWLENKESRSGVNHHNFGKIMSDEQKEKIKVTVEVNGSFKRGKNPKAKLVIDMETGIIYDCLKDAAIAKDMNYSTLRSMLQGNNRNKTQLKYI